MILYTVQGVEGGGGCEQLIGTMQLTSVTYFTLLPTDQKIMSNFVIFAADTKDGTHI